MYIQTSYSELHLLKKAIREFFDILCADESRSFRLHILEVEKRFAIAIDGLVDDYTSHNLVSWLARPGFWERSFETVGRIKLAGREHLVAPNSDDKNGETLLANGMDGSRYLISLPDCAVRNEWHPSELSINDTSERTWIATVEPPAVERAR